MNHNNWFKYYVYDARFLLQMMIICNTFHIPSYASHTLMINSTDYFENTELHLHI